MKLTTQITQTKEIEITLPVFFKENDNGYDNYLAILNEQTAISLYINKGGDHVAIVHTTPDKKSFQIRNAINLYKKWEKISEVDFLQAYDDALSAISLRPKLSTDCGFVESLNVLDLKSNGG